MAQEFIVTAQVVIDMPRGEVWQRMQDMTVSKYYVPGLLDCRMTTEQQRGVGASRKVYMKRMVMDETVTEWEEGRGFLLRLHNGVRPPPMFSQASCRYRLEDSPDGRSIFIHTLSYAMRGGFFGTLLARLLMNGVMQKSATAVAENLKRYYETGKPTNSAYRAA